jgi:hydroxymethylpyrimidine/phosphomethylpyrimidine kinase
MSRRIPVCLSIAGSDSGGGAGIQADIKAFANAGVHGTTALTALTAQNTQAVTGVHPVPPDFIVEQVRAVADDLGIDAVKVGMVGSQRGTVAVAQALDELAAGTPVVLDPVMVAESGARLLEEDAEEALRTLLVPRATVVTPNLLEARVLVRDATLDGEELARRVHSLGADVVVVTGGHRAESADLFFDGSTFATIPGPRHADGAAHGSGCTHSSTLAAQLALGASPLEAARIARDVAAEAVRRGLRELGRGDGPVDVLGVADRQRARSALS